MEKETITFEEVEKRLKNKPIEQWSKQDIFDRYVAYGSEDELKDPKVQRLLIKNGYAQELLEIAPNIDVEVMEEVLEVLKDTDSTNGYCTLDIETSGIFETESEITEIAIAKVKDGKIVDTFTALIKPNKQLNTKVQEITNISNKVLQYAEDINTVLPKAMKFIGNDIIVCHNSKFIMAFLKYNCNNLGMKLENEVIDTINIGSKLFPNLKSRKLSTICERMGLTYIKTLAPLQEVYILVYIYEYYKNLSSKR